MEKQAKKKNKKMTAKEKILRRETKKELQKKGILPPDKPRLNRKKFADEVFEERSKNGEVDLFDIYTALCIMLPDRGSKGTYIGRLTTENVTALKILKMAMEIGKIRNMAKKENKNLTIGELYEKAIEPILKL